MLSFWRSRWEAGRTGWHESDGSSALRKFWPALTPGSHVLVPLCGKSVDLLWLAEQGCEVTGVELSEIAARAFFNEAGLQFEIEKAGEFTWFRCQKMKINIACGNYFEFSGGPYDALYDRASLVALPPKLRPQYVEHTRAMLKSDATLLLVTLEYDQSKTEGPPFSILAGEVKSYWGKLQRISEHDDIENSPPKFRDAGILEVLEVVYLGP
jgi:thiopurine S-methyltransferase